MAFKLPNLCTCKGFVHHRRMQRYKDVGSHNSVSLCCLHPPCVPNTMAEQQKGGKRDVEAIWRSMNTSTCRRSKQSLEKLWHGFSSDISKPSSRAVAAQDTEKRKAQQQLKLDPLSCKLTAQEKPEAADSDASAPITSLEGAAGSMDRIVLSLQSADASIRRATLQQTQATFITCTPPLEPEAVADVLSCKLGKALLRRFEDTSEACRELAVTTLQAMLQVTGSAGPQPTLRFLCISCIKGVMACCHVTGGSCSNPVPAAIRYAGAGGTAALRAGGSISASWGGN